MGWKSGEVYAKDRLKEEISVEDYIFVGCQLLKANKTDSSFMIYRFRKERGKINMEATMKYRHNVNKSEIPVCNILGVNIAAIDMNWLLDFTDKHIKELSGDYMCVFKRTYHRYRF